MLNTKTAILFIYSQGMFREHGFIVQDATGVNNVAPAVIIFNGIKVQQIPVLQCFLFVMDAGN